MLYLLHKIVPKFDLLIPFLKAFIDSSVRSPLYLNVLSRFFPLVVVIVNNKHWQMVTDVLDH